MNAVTAVINVILGSGRKYQISSEIPLDECDTLRKLNTYCLQLVNMPNYYVTELKINDSEITDDDYTLQLTDNVKLTVSDIQKSTSSTTSLSSLTALHIVLPVETSNASTSTTPSSSAPISPLSPTPSTSASCVDPLRPFSYYQFLPADDYFDWITKNAARVHDCYRSCIPNKGLTYGDKNLYNYFNDSSSKPVFVLYGLLIEEEKRTGSCNHLLMNQAEEHILKALATFLHNVYPSYDIYCSGINTFLTLMATWLEYPVFIQWAQLSSKCRLHKMIKKRRIYYGASGHEPPIPIFTSADQLGIDKLATDLRNSSTSEEAERHLRDTVHLRKTWVTKLCNDTELERGIATVFFQKFPIFNTRLELLHMDFEFTMRRLLNFVPDLNATLKKYAPTILYTAITHSVEVLTGEEDHCYKAVHALPALVKKFAPRCRQKPLSHLFTVTNNLNINAALVHRMNFTTSPSLIATNWGEKITFYVAVDDFALHTASTDIAEAMQRLFEVYYVLDLAYDIHMKDLFQLLESLMGMKPETGVGVKNLSVAIKYFYEQPRDNFQQLIDATSHAAPTTTATSYDSADPFAGLPLSPAESQDIFDESTVNVPIPSPTVEHNEHVQEQNNNETDSVRHNALEGTDFISPHRLSQSTESMISSNQNRGASSTRSRGYQRTSSNRTAFSTSTPIPSQERLQQRLTSTPILRRPSSNFEPQPKRSRGRPRKSTTTIHP